MGKILLVDDGRGLTRELRRLGIETPVKPKPDPPAKSRQELRAEARAQAEEFVNSRFPKQSREGRRKIANDLARRNWKFGRPAQ